MSENALGNVSTSILVLQSSHCRHVIICTVFSTVRAANGDTGVSVGRNRKVAAFQRLAMY